MPGKPLSNVDTAWLRMEDPTNLMMITGLTVLDSPVNYERLQRTLEHTLLPYDRFRQRVIMPRLPLEHPHWQEDPHFDWGYHLKKIVMPPGSDKDALQEVLSQLMSTPLNFSRPLWQFHLVDNYGKGAAIISRMHHCIADGIALMNVLLSMTSDNPEAPLPDLPEKVRSYRKRNEIEELFPPVSQVFDVTSRVTGALIHESIESLVNPQHAIDLAKLGTKSVEAFGRLLLRWPDPKTIFKGGLGTSKRAAYSEAVPLADVKYIGKVFGGTVNDTLLTAVSGALRRYMLMRGASPDGINIRAVVPVNLRPFEKGKELGNSFGLVFLSLPIDIPDARERLNELKRRMDSIKNTPEALVAFGILNTIGLAPTEIEKIVVNIFQTKGTGVMTNVPGPQKQLYFAGAPVNTLIAWVPQSGHLGLGVSIISYNHNVWVGIATDEGLVPDPESIVDLFYKEYVDLLCTAKRLDAGLSCPAVPVIGMLDGLLGKLDGMIADAQNKKQHELKKAAEEVQKTSVQPVKARISSKSKAKPAKGVEQAGLGSAEALLVEAFSAPQEALPIIKREKKRSSTGSKQPSETINQ